MIAARSPQPPTEPSSTPGYADAEDLESEARSLASLRLKDLQAHQGQSPSASATWAFRFDDSLVWSTLALGSELG